MEPRVSPEEHLAQVQASVEGAGDARLVEIVQAAVRHLHAFVTEVGLTRDEWFAGVDFLTRVGQMCDDRRQEVILLSDVLGVSMLVEMTGRAATPGTTEPTVFGPFHVEGAPPRPLGSTVVDRDVGGEPLTVHGTVRDAAGARRRRGLPRRVADRAQRAVRRPGRRAAGDEPAGRLHHRRRRPVLVRHRAAGRLPDPGRRPGRRAAAGDRPPQLAAGPHPLPHHRAGYEPLITHVFDRASDYLDSDAVFGVRPSLIVDMDGGEARFDPVLAPAVRA